MITENNLITIKEQLGLILDNNAVERLNCWHVLFKEYNSHTNLMSKNDIEVLFEKHVFDSLAIVKWDKFKNINSLLDVGTGGGFPSAILAICFPDKKIFANDSRIKKINFIKLVKEKLKLDNLEIIYSRIEDVSPLKVDLIVSRAVGKMLDVYDLSKKHLKKNGDFLIYKARLTQEEIELFKTKYNQARFEIISYELPLSENFERNLVVLK